MLFQLPCPAGTGLGLRASFFAFSRTDSFKMRVVVEVGLPGSIKSGLSGDRATVESCLPRREFSISG